MNEHTFPKEVSTFATMTIWEKLKRTVKLTKKHGGLVGIILLLMFSGYLGFFMLVSFIVGGLNATEALDLLMGNYSILSLPTFLFINVLYLFITIFEVGVNSLLLRHIHGDDVDNVNGIILEPFSRLKTIIVPICFWLLINFMIAYAMDVTTEENPLLFLICFLIIICSVCINICFCFYIAEIKNASLTEAIIEPFRLVYKNLMGWIGIGVLFFFLIMFIGVVIVVLVEIVFLVNSIWTLKALSFFALLCILALLSTLYLMVSFSYFTALTYRQSSARLLLQGEAGPIDLLKDSPQDSISDSPNDLPQDSSSDSDKNN